MTDWSLFGFHAGAHHLTNVFLHGLSTLLLFAVLHRITGERWPSALVAFLFGLHPLHVESVAWIAERKDVLSGLFWFLTSGHTYDIPSARKRHGTRCCWRRSRWGYSPSR